MTEEITLISPPIPAFIWPAFVTICSLCEGEARHISGPGLYCGPCLQMLAERSSVDNQPKP